MAPCFSLNLVEMEALTTEHTWQLFSDRLYRFILSRVKNDDAARDIRQDVFMRIHERLPQLQDAKKLQSWVFAMTRNRIADHFNSRSFADPVEEWPEDEQAPPIEFLSCLLPVLESLPPKYQEAVRRADLGEVPQKELAEQLGISYSGLKSRVQRGRELLREALLDCCRKAGGEPCGRSGVNDECGTCN